MNKESILEFIRATIHMPQEKAIIVADKFELIDVAKNVLLITENATTKFSYILESGFMRSYTIDKIGDEVTTNILSPFCFVNDFMAFFKQQPASENFQTITACKIWRMSYEDVQASFHNIPEFREFGRMMLVTNYTALKERMLGMIKDTAEARYIKLMHQHPQIIQNVPLKIIASYLGITDSSLSRIRRDITNT